MRSFHATREFAEEADYRCFSLGFTENELQAMRQFTYRNCQFNLHQCFSCGRLGSSDLLAGAQVFQCK
ncbi:hypothetical protein SOVF_062240 [Spinacia oleracea]|nr:hypothetical protein SOVF_062240 [Spinacia oleracea]